MMRRYLLLNRRDNGMRIYNDRCFAGAAAAADAFFAFAFSFFKCHT